MSNPLVFVFSTVFTAFVGGLFAHLFSLRADKKNMINQYLTRSVSEFYLAYGRYLSDPSDTNRAALLATACSVRLFFPEQHISAIDQLLLAVQKHTAGASSDLGNAFRSFEQLCRDVLSLHA